MARWQCSPENIEAIVESLTEESERAGAPPRDDKTLG